VGIPLKDCWASRSRRTKRKILVSQKIFGRIWEKNIFVIDYGILFSPRLRRRDEKKYLSSILDR
jgi:hypothetical protein